MADAVFFSVVALAKAGIECCRNARVCKEEAARIGKRLTIIVARAHEWGAVCESTHLFYFHDIVKNVFLSLQAATLFGDKRSSWNNKFKNTLQSQALLDKILEAESQLNTAINDLQMEQSNVIFSQLVDVSKGVAELLDQFGALRMCQSDPSVTIQEQFDRVLADTQKEATEVAVSPPEDRNHKETQEQDSTLRTRGRNIVSHQQPKPTFRPSKEDLLAISLQPSLLSFCDDPASLLGGGGFAEVFRGTYDFRPVAIKRLKVYRRDMASLSPIQIAQDVEQLAAEALLTHKCGSHSNIIHVVGCITTLNEVERPLIVMELMHTTLFDALHDKVWRSTMGFSRCLFLLKGIAGALEFLHLQGIVHHDIKSLNILLNKDLTVAKLADFGESKVKGLHTTKLRLGSIMATTSHQGNQIAGTAAYQAPEILSEEVNDTSRSCEMFSFGVTVWECLTRKIPHGGKKESTIILLAATKKHLPMLVVPPHPFKGISEIELASWKALKGVATICLSRDRSVRPTASVVGALWSKFKSPETETPFFLPLQNPETQIPTSPISQWSSSHNLAVDMPDSKADSSAGGSATSKTHCCITIWFVALIAILLTTVVAVLVVVVFGSSSRPLSPEVPAGAPDFDPLPTPAPKSTPPTGVPLSTLSPTSETESMSNILPSDTQATDPPKMADSPGHLTFQTTKELYDAVDFYVGIQDSEFSLAASRYGYPIGSWDVSRITDFSYLFDSMDRNVATKNFSEDLSSWDVSAATTMSAMFNGASTFNGDLSLWKVEQVTDMSLMFNGATSFNSKLSLWNVSKVTDMSGMFAEASAFNRDLSLWNVKQVKDMSGMFGSATVFNTDISMWNVRKVTDMSGMFASASAFNRNLSLWDVSQVTDMSWMFEEAFTFHEDISMWNVGKVANMRFMFRGATSFNSKLSLWNVSKVLYMDHMFDGAEAFSGDISTWNVGQVTDMAWMFRKAFSFNSSLCLWLTQMTANTSVRKVFSQATSCPDTTDTMFPQGPMCHTC